MTALLLGLTLAGCGGDDSDESSESTPSASVGDTADNTADEGTADDSTGGDSDGSDGEGSDDTRAFDSDDDAVVGAVLAATRGDRADWEGKTLIVHFAEGSAEDPLSGPKCGAAIVLADDEKLVLRFSDGEIDCSQR